MTCMTRNLCALLMLLASTALSQRVTATIATGTDPFSVAVNPATNKIYVTATGTSNTVTVIDGRNNSTTSVNVGSSPNAVAVNPVTNKIYVANQGNNSVTIIDGASNSTTTVPTTGTNPIALAVNPVTNKIYVANTYSGNVTVIDGVTNMTSTVTVGSNPIVVAVNPVTNKIYVANEGSSFVTVIDGATNATKIVSVGPAAIALAVNPVTNKIYVVTGLDLAVIDGSNNSTTQVAVGTNATSVAVNPVTDKIYVANNGAAPTYSGSVTVIDGPSNATVTVPAGHITRAVVVDSKTNQIYVANKGSNNVTVLDGVTNAVTTLTAGSSPFAAAVNPVTDKVYVANLNSSNVSVVDGATYQKTDISGVGAAFSMDVNPVTNRIYVPQSLSNTVAVIDGATNSVIATIPVGQDPYTVAVNPITNKIYVGNYYDKNLTVIDGATNATTNVQVGLGVAQIGINPVTNKIYVIGNQFTVIDGVTGSITATLSISGSPMLVDPVMNKIYLGLSDSLTIVDGATNASTVLLTNDLVTGLSLNPITHKLYVGLVDDQVGVLDTGTNTFLKFIATGANPRAVAVNAVSNKVYVATFENITVIDGVTDTVKGTVPAGSSGAFTLTVNPVTNKIYALPDDYPAVAPNLTVIDGSTDTATSVASTVVGPMALNPVTNRLYVTSESVATVSVIDEQNTQPSTLTTSITPLPGNQTNQSTPAFTFTAGSSTVAMPEGVYFQADTWQNAWSQASGTNPTYNGTLATLQPGIHTLYAFAVDGQHATSTQIGSPFIGDIQAYSFLVKPANYGGPVVFQGLDTVTEGAWTGKYGSGGYVIAGDTATPLNHTNVSLSQYFTFIWAGLTSDPRALQIAPGASEGIAAAYVNYYGQSVYLNINVYDSKPHQVALYLLGWDSAARSETITIRDASTGVLYDTETFTGFQNGEYAIWQMQGNLAIEITPTYGPSAAVSGIFID